MKRYSFTVGDEFAALIDSWCEAEGVRPAAYLRRVVAAALEWTLTDDDEPPSHRQTSVSRARSKKGSNNKRGEAIQRAIDEARARQQRLLDRKDLN